MNRYISEEDARSALRTLAQYSGKPLDKAVRLSIDDIKVEWRRLARKFHPDRNKDANAADIFKVCTAAFETLDKYVQDGNSLPDPRKTPPRPKPNRTQSSRTSRRQTAPSRAEATMGGYDPVAARERRRKVASQLDQMAGSSCPPFGSQATIPTSTTMPYRARPWGVPPGQSGTPMAAFGQQTVVQLTADDFLHQAASFFQQAAQVNQVLQNPSPNGFVQDIVNLVGQHVQATPRFYVTHEELARYSQIAASGGSAAMIQGVLHQPGAAAQQGRFTVQLQGSTALVNGVPCTVHVQ